MNDLNKINKDQYEFNKSLEKLSKGIDYTINLIFLIVFASFILGFLIGLGID